VVPDSDNRDFVLDVLSLDIHVRRDGPETATMVVLAPKVPHNPQYSGVNGWHITFGTVRGYQLTRISESRLGIRDFQPSGRDWAMWEVAASSWLPQGNRYPLYHFVIADEDAVYELAAEMWEAEQLPDGWEQSTASSSMQWD
jgi:hypothetical protein